MIAPIMERTPSDMASTKPPRFMSLRGRNMQAATTSATQAPMHRPMTGFSADRRGEVDTAEEAAHVHHAQNGEHDEHQNGHDKIPDGTALGDVQALVLLNGPGGGVVDVALLGHHRGDVRRAFQIDLGLVGDAGERDRLKRRTLGGNAPLGIGLSRGHRAEVLLQEQHEEHEEDGQQRVEVVGDGGHESVEAVLAHIAAHSHGPRGHRCDDADRGRRGVDDPGELLVADAELVRHRRMTAPTVRQLK